MRCRAFTFLVKFGLVLIYVLKVRKNMFNSLLTFFYENYVPFQVLKDFSVENFKTTPSTFFLNFFSEIYLSRIINYCCSIFTLYLTLKAFSLVCLLSTFFLVFLFLLIFFFFFWKTLAIHRIAQNGEWIIIFLVFHFHSLTSTHLIHRDFYHFFSIDLFVITGLIADETCSP